MNEQARANLDRAATMDQGASFELGPTDISTRRIRQAEKLFNRMRQQAGNSGRVRLSRVGQSVKVEIVR